MCKVSEHEHFNLLSMCDGKQDWRAKLKNELKFGLEMLSEGRSKCGLKRSRSPGSHERVNEYHRQWYQYNKDAVNTCRRDAYQELKRYSTNHQHDGVENDKYGNMSSAMGRRFSWNCSFVWMLPIFDEKIHWKFCKIACAFLHPVIARKTLEWSLIELTPLPIWRPVLRYQYNEMRQPKSKISFW